MRKIVPFLVAGGLLGLIGCTQPKTTTGGTRPAVVRRDTEPDPTTAPATGPSRLEPPKGFEKSGDANKTEPPKIEPPKIDPPKTEAPKTEPPKTEPPKTPAPK